MTDKGKVILAGAGPGDPELITLKAYKYLQQADVILYDRLVSEEILKRYANPCAELVYVGKQGHCQANITQQQINFLLLDYYHPEKLIVRLKGGDTAFYSNIFDELLTLSDNNIPYEIIPGITAAAGASAYCGIPLTARGYADSVKFITYSGKKNPPESYWSNLAQSNDTLVFYMSSERLSSLLRHLITAGIGNDKHIAVIEQATTPMQQITVYRFNHLPLIFPHFQSPSLIIIGKVVALHQQFQWKENASENEVYFKNLLLQSA